MEEYIPDFSAKLGSERARIVRVKKSIFDAGRKVFLFDLRRTQSLRDMTGVPAVAVDPTVRHAFANQLFARKKSLADPTLCDDRPISEHNNNAEEPEEPLQRRQSTGRLSRV